MDRLGVLGDIHCEDEVLSAALEFFTREQVDRVLSVGDVVDGPGSPHRTLELLSSGPVDAVAGNHDRWYLTNTVRGLPDATPAGALSGPQRAWLAALPTTRTYQTPCGPLLLCHGLGDDDMATLRPDDSGYGLENNDGVNRLVTSAAHRLVVSGHSHQRMVRRLGNVTFINAGTLLRHHGPGVLLLDLAALTATFFDWVAPRLVPTPPLPLPLPSSPEFQRRR